MRRGPGWLDEMTEPAATPDQPVRADLGLQGGDQLRREFRSQLRRIFVLVDQYLLLCRLDSERYRLEALMRDLLVEVRDCFVTAAMLRADSAQLNPEHERCVRELEEFLLTLRGSCPPATLDMIHALDSVVVHCFILDAERREAQPEWPEGISMRMS